MRPLTNLAGKPYFMTPVIYTAGQGIGGRCYLSSKRKLRLGVYFCFRLFNVVPETTARFFHLDD